MDDLALIRVLMDEPPPTQGVVSGGHERLLALVAQEHSPPGPPRRAARRMAGRGAGGRRGTGWAAGAGLIAAAAAVASIVALAVPALHERRGPAAGSTPVARPSSGQQILLAAAAVAQRRPAVSGRYWHVKVGTVMRAVTAPEQFQNEYFAPSGASWLTMKPGTVTRQTGPGGGFWLAGGPVSFAQIQRLPTSPPALRAWAFGRVQRYDRIIDRQGKPIGPARRAAENAAETIGELTKLLYYLPAPPPVRAAALRALASFPSVKSLGQAGGGQALLISGETGAAATEIVIDPATSMVRAIGYGLAGSGGALAWTKGTQIVITAAWTNRLPKVIPLPPGTR